MKTLTPDRTAVLTAAVIVAIAVAAWIATSTWHLHVGSLPAWHLLGWAVVAVIGLVIGAHHGVQSTPDEPAVGFVGGAFVGGILGTMAGAVWPLVAWAAICTVAFRDWLIPWADRGTTTPPTTTFHGDEDE